METTIYFYMTTTHRSACQTKWMPNVAQTTKGTDKNIKKLRVYLSNEKKLGSTNK